jgi:hypothetical protein
MITKGLLVGAHFNPPAKWILAVLPSGTPLELAPEPDNPYDPEAVKVLVWPARIPSSHYEQLEESLAGTGFTVDGLLVEGPITLGHLAREGGKPLQGKPWASNREISKHMAQGNWTCRLAFSGDGDHLVVVETQE